MAGELDRDDGRLRIMKDATFVCVCERESAVPELLSLYQGPVGGTWAGERAGEGC